MHKIKTSTLFVIIVFSVHILIVWVIYPSSGSLYRKENNYDGLFNSELQYKENAHIVDYTGTLNAIFSYPKMIKRENKINISDVKFVFHENSFSDTEFRVCQSMIDYVGEKPVTISGTFIEIEGDNRFVCRHQILDASNGVDVKEKYFYAFPYREKTATLNLSISYSGCKNTCEKFMADGVDVLIEKIVESVMER